MKKLRAGGGHQLREQESITTGFARSAFLAHIQEFIGCGKNRRLAFANEKYISELIQVEGIEADAWKSLFSFDFDESVLLLKDLKQMHCLIAYNCH